MAHQLQKCGYRIKVNQYPVKVRLRCKNMHLLKIEITFLQFSWRKMPTKLKSKSTLKTLKIFEISK